MNRSGLIDIHCHLEMIKKETGDVLKRALDAGVDRCITIGTHPKEFSQVLQISERWKVPCTLGVHPHEASFFTQEVEEDLREKLLNQRVVAMGEMGLDYHYNHSEPSIQRRAFVRQLELACEYGFPVQIHTREAEEDTRSILRDFSGKVTGVFHCFTGTMELAEFALETGFDLSFSGIVTFKGAKALQEVAKRVPLDRIHVETDAPFLAPVPLRGQECEPFMVTHTAQFLANLRGISTEELSRETSKNSLRLFPRLKDL